MSKLLKVIKNKNLKRNLNQRIRKSLLKDYHQKVVNRLGMMNLKKNKNRNSQRRLLKKLYSQEGEEERRILNKKLLRKNRRIFTQMI